jgi:hypothetical protein
MQVCDVHDVAYNTQICPACEIEDKLQQAIDNRDVEIADLKDQIAFLEEQANGQ